MRMVMVSCCSRMLHLSPSSASILPRRRLGGGGGITRCTCISLLASRSRHDVRPSSTVVSFCSSSNISTSPTQESQSQSQPQAEEDKSEPEEDVRKLASLLDIRVGRILKAWRHPEADSLYVEEVDVGEEQPRTICSGLVDYVPLHQLQTSKVIVLANLRARNMRGIKSNGMLMAASDESHEIVELLMPPEGSIPGERIWFGSEDDKDSQPNATTPNQVQKKKIWESVQPHLRTTNSCVAVLGTHLMRTSAGAVFCKSLKGGRIS